MTKIINKIPEKNMQTHIDKAYQLLDDHLPERYTSEVMGILNEKGITASSGVIRNVRTRVTETRIDVLNALLQVAKKYKKQFETLQNSIK